MKRWNRRNVIGLAALTTAGAAFSRTAYGTASGAAQLPMPEPLDDAKITLVTTSEAKAWQKGSVFKRSFGWDWLHLIVGSDQVAAAHERRGMEGFGACFNELGWTSLSLLNPEDRAKVMQELFDPAAGARFTYCRMPVGANDFSMDWYSYDESNDDFALKDFSIAHDKSTLIPFIHAAQKYQPELKLWASPWSPPTWMKRNHFYAEAPARGGWKDNGIRPDQVGHEGEDIFIQEPRYFETYAKYFVRFVEGYKAEGINVGMVMPQNEFNSAQNFPSCTWTAEGLAHFLRYLGPEMKKHEVEVFFGTMERGNPKLFETIMKDPEAARYVKGVGMQWAGKMALGEVHREYPELTIFQSEQECGDGDNSWTYTGYCWQLMKDYFRNGTRGYMYWNISLEAGTKSTWGWAQNSLVSVDRASKSFTYNHDYYLLKHLTHFVDVGAKYVETTGTCDDSLGFLNPDGTTVLLVRNQLAHMQMVEVQCSGRVLTIQLPADSLSTLTIKV